MSKKIHSLESKLHPLEFQTLKTTELKALESEMTELNERKYFVLFLNTYDVIVSFSLILLNIISEIANEIARLAGSRANRKELENLLVNCQSWLKDKSLENVVTSKYEPLLSSTAESSLQNLKVSTYLKLLNIFLFGKFT